MEGGEFRPAIHGIDLGRSGIVAGDESDLAGVDVGLEKGTEHGFGFGRSEGRGAMNGPARVGTAVFFDVDGLDAPIPHQQKLTYAARYSPSV